MMKASITKINVYVFKVPTDSLESDGTFTWDSTTMVLVQLEAAGKTGIGYSYAHQSAATLIESKLKEVVIGQNAMAIEKCWYALLRQVRNLGRPGIASHAISAVDNALWDLKAKILSLPLCQLIGNVKDEIAVYGSGGFTSYSDQQMQEQFQQWLDVGIQMFKMKIGGQPKDKDLTRVEAARSIIGDKNELFVDANGAYSTIEALAMADDFKDYKVSWFEEPVSSDNLKGLHLIKLKSTAALAITAGEYGYDQYYFQKMLEADAVDVLQLDATRCLGITGLIKSAHLAESFHVPVSAHTAPGIHLHPLLGLSNAVHIEYFYDHTRIEKMLFEGIAEVHNGNLSPDLSRPGLGIDFKMQDAEKYRAD